MKRKYVFLPLLLLGSVSLSSSPSPRVTHFAPHYAAPSTEPSIRKLYAFITGKNILVKKILMIQIVLMF